MSQGGAAPHGTPLGVPAELADQSEPQACGAIQGILFDIAGVLVALDGVPTMSRLLNAEPNHEMRHAQWLASAAVRDHETGRIDADTFARRIVREMRLPTTAETFLEEFTAWPKGLLPGAHELLVDIAPQYRLAALSNTSAIHWALIDTFGFTHRFDALYLSHRIGHLKPDAQSYRTAILGMGLPAASVLFLDDSARNVAAAADAGLRAFCVKGPNDARAILRRYALLKPGA